MTAYATQQDLLEAVAQDSQAKLSNDPLTKWLVGVGDGATTIVTTPFLQATSVTAYVDGVQTAVTLLAGTGVDGADRIEFAPAPAAGKAVTASADKNAINLAVITKALENASEEINGYLTRYALPITDATALRILRSKTVSITKYRLRGRRDLAAADPVRDEYKDAIRWLEKVATGAIELPTGATTPTVVVDEGLVDAEDPVFDAPAESNT